MATREDIATVFADVGGDKSGRVARLRAQRLLDQLIGNLPFTWQPRANVLVIIKAVSVRGATVSFFADLTIRDETKSLSEWVEGKHSPPDWQITNPPPFVDDPAGNVTFVMDDGTTRRGRDDFVAAMRQVFDDTFGSKIAGIVRGAR